MLKDVGGGVKAKDVKDRVRQSQDTASGTQSKVNVTVSNAEGVALESSAFTSNTQPNETNDGTKPEGSIVCNDLSDFKPRSLSAIPLRWMMKEAIKSGGGILFDSERARSHRFTVPKNYGNVPHGFDDAQFYFGVEAEECGIARYRELDVQSPSYIASKASYGSLSIISSLMRFTHTKYVSSRLVYPHHIIPFYARTMQRRELTLARNFLCLLPRANFPLGTTPRRLSGTPLFHESVREREQLPNNPDAKLQAMSGEDRYKPLAEPLPDSKDRQYVE